MCVDDICRDSEFVAPEQEDTSTAIIKVIGVGGGGGNAVGYMYRQNVKGVNFVVCNTDRQALKNSPVPTRVLLGHTGLGAGDNPEVAREAAEESIDAINALFDKNTKMVFITAGMGGGTGTGAAPVVARVAREHNVLTVGIVTIPFYFEGTRKIKKALEGAENIRKYVDALLLINNERLIDIYPDLGFEDAFDKADDTLSTAAKSISDLITNENVKINVDFNDVDTTLRNGGTAIISCGYGEGENRVNDAIQNALTSPLLRNNNILGSKRLCFDMAYSREASTPFRMGEMAAFTEFVNSIEDVAVKYGVSYDETLGDKVKITILASGFEMEALVPEPVKPSGHTKPKDAPKQQVATERIIETLYGPKDLKRSLYVILTPDQLDDDDIIEQLENSPTATRSKDTVASITKKTDSTPEPAPQSSRQDPPADSNAISFL